MSGTLTIEDTDIGIFQARPYNVILFNDEHHSMEEVVAQIMKAINCTEQTATNIMLEAHVSGRAVVFNGSLERCELVASILEEIRLGTKIESC